MLGNFPWVIGELAKGNFGSTLHFTKGFTPKRLTTNGFRPGEGGESKKATSL